MRYPLIISGLVSTSLQDNQKYVQEKAVGIFVFKRKDFADKSDTLITYLAKKLTIGHDFNQH